MGIEIEKSFVVAAPRATVWAFLVDPQRVARCLPGAAITEQVSEREFTGTMTVKVGPVTASYRGKLRFERLDEAAGEAELAASGQETRGKGGADMRMRSRVLERAPGETEVTVVSDVNVFGILAQFGRGMIQDVSDQMFQKFSTAMRRELEPAPVAVAGGGDAPTVAVAAPSAAAAASAPTAATPLGSTPTPATVTSAPTQPAAPAPPAAPTAPAVAGENVLDVGQLGAQVAGRAALRTLRRPGFWIAVAAIAALVWWWLRSRG